MRETFPRKEAGHAVSRQHLNRLSRTVRDLASGAIGSFVHNQSGVVAAPLPFQQTIVIIVEGDQESSNSSSSSSSSSLSSSSESESGQSSASSGGDSVQLYDVRPRYWDPATGSWKTSTDQGVWQLDAGAVNQTFEPGDLVVAFYHPDRGAYIPIKSSGACDTVRFTVRTTDAATRTGVGDIVSVPVGCTGSSLAGSMEGGTALPIADPAGCFLNEPDSVALVGRQGGAHYMQPLELTVCQPDVTDPAKLLPQWEIAWLCCDTNNCV